MKSGGEVGEFLLEVVEVVQFADELGQEASDFWGEGLVEHIFDVSFGEFHLYAVVLIVLVVLFVEYGVVFEACGAFDVLDEFFPFVLIECGEVADAVDVFLIFVPFFC